MNHSMKKLAVLLAAAPLLLCAPLASSADASSAGDPGAFVLSEAEVDQMARNTHDFNQAIAAGNAAAVDKAEVGGVAGVRRCQPPGRTRTTLRCSFAKSLNNVSV